MIFLYATVLFYNVKSFLFVYYLKTRWPLLFKYVYKSVCVEVSGIYCFLFAVVLNWGSSIVGISWSRIDY